MPRRRKISEWPAQSGAEQLGAKEDAIWRPAQSGPERFGAKEDASRRPAQSGAEQLSWVDRHLKTDRGLQSYLSWAKHRLLCHQDVSDAAYARWRKYKIKKKKIKTRKRNGE